MACHGIWKKGVLTLLAERAELLTPSSWVKKDTLQEIYREENNS